MAIEITNTFVNAESILASDHNINYSDALSHINDGTHDLSVSDVDVNDVLSVNGATVLGTADTHAVNINSTIQTSILASSGKNAGSSSKPFTALYLQETSALNFDGGTTYKLQSSSTEMDWIPSNQVGIYGALKNTTISFPTVNADAVYPGNRVKGNRYTLTFRGYNYTPSSGVDYVLDVPGGVAYSTAAHGFIIPAAGSIVGYSVNAYMNVSSSTSMTVKLLKNGSSFVTLATFSSISSDGYRRSLSTVARGTNTFVADDVLTVVLNKSSGTLDYTFVYVTLEFVLN